MTIEEFITEVYCFIDDEYKNMELLGHGINLQTPMRNNMQDNRPKWFLKFMRSKRKIIETIISQLAMIFNIKSIRVRDLWHLNRLTRKILAHNISNLINLKYGLNMLNISPIVN